MRPLHYRSFALRAFATLLLSVVALQTAQAEFVGSLIQVNVSAGELSGSWELDVPAGSDPFDWYLPEPVNIYSTQQPGTLLATIDGLSLGLDGDPQVLLNFAVTAGASNTNFSINSALVGFSPLASPPALATAGITVTDNNGNGGSATGSFAGTKSYEARYNGGSTFADLVSPVIAPANDSNTGSQTLGFLPIAGSVSSIQSEFRFTLTATDSAAGTSRFTVVPEPSTILLCLMGVATLAAVRPRRR